MVGNLIFYVICKNRIEKEIISQTPILSGKVKIIIFFGCTNVNIRRDKKKLKYSRRFMFHRERKLKIIRLSEHV